MSRVCRPQYLTPIFAFGLHARSRYCLAHSSLSRINPSSITDQASLSIPKAGMGQRNKSHGHLERTGEARRLKQMAKIHSEDVAYPLLSMSQAGILFQPLYCSVLPRA